MTLADLEAKALFQTNNDIDDLDDYIECLPDYINEGYDRLAYAFAKKHLASDDPDGYVPLENDTDAPIIPEWAHVGIRDYATYCLYRNGNPSKQQRGMAFYQAFQQIEQQLRYGDKLNGLHFHNLYKERSVW